MAYPRDPANKWIPETTPEIKSRCDGYQIMINGRKTLLLDCTRTELAVDAVQSMDRVRELNRLVERLHISLRDIYLGKATVETIGEPEPFIGNAITGKELVAYQMVSRMSRDDLLLAVAHQIDQMTIFEIIAERVQKECEAYFSGREPDRSSQSSVREADDESPKGMNM